MNIELTSQISELVDQFANLYRSNLSSSRASGRLENFTTFVDISDERFLISFELEDYWRFVEEGRSPGKMPPLGPIENWIKVKPVIPNPQNGRIPTTKQLAYLIARKIGREGTEGQFPLKKTLESSDSLISAIKQAILEQVMTYIT